MTNSQTPKELAEELATLAGIEDNTPCSSSKDCQCRKCWIKKVERSIIQVALTETGWLPSPNKQIPLKNERNITISIGGSPIEEVSGWNFSTIDEETIATINNVLVDGIESWEFVDDNPPSVTIKGKFTE